MKKYPGLKKLFGCMVLLTLAYESEAQFSSGSSFIVAAGTPLFIDSLTFQPDVDNLTMTNTNITVSHTPIPPAGTGSGSIERVYDINPAISFRGTTGMYYIDDELNGNTGTLLSYVYDDGSSAFGTTDITTVDNSGNYVEASTGLSTITLRRITSVDADVPLPVNLLSFTAIADGDKTRLNWVTASEDNCDYFNVERSTDGAHFSFIVAERGNGTSSTEHRYQTYDNKPSQGWNYYRLKQVDMDRQYSYSEVVPVFFGKGSGTEILVYPNPSTTALSIIVKTSSSDDEKLLLLDVSGRIMAEKKMSLSAGTNSFNIDISNIAAGTYLLKVGTQHQVKVVKQ